MFSKQYSEYRETLISTFPVGKKKAVNLRKEEVGFFFSEFGIENLVCRNTEEGFFLEIFFSFFQFTSAWELPGHGLNQRLSTRWEGAANPGSSGISNAPEQLEGLNPESTFPLSFKS